MKNSPALDLYRDYRRRLDVRRVLEHYGAEHVSEMVNKDGTTEIVHSCLLDRIEPHHANGDAHASAWANIEKGLYVCSVYWSGDILRLIQKLEGVEDLDGLTPVIGHFLNGATKDTDSFRQEIEAAFAQQSYSVDIPSYSERVLDPWRVSHPYMREVRGVSHEAQVLLGIGYDASENRIVFPHRWEERLVGWQKRAITASPDWPGTIPDWPKYRSSSGFPKSETFYAGGLAVGADAIVVVESPMSVAKAYSLGYRLPTLATFGAKVSKTQIDLLKDFKCVYVWFDEDPAGHAGERKLVDGLYRHTEVLVIPPDEGRDLGDFDSADEVAEKVESAIPAALWLAARDQEEVR